MLLLTLLMALIEEFFLIIVGLSLLLLAAMAVLAPLSGDSSRDATRIRLSCVICVFSSSTGFTFVRSSFRMLVSRSISATLRLLASETEEDLTTLFRPADRG